LHVKSYENNIDSCVKYILKPQKKEEVLGNPKKKMKKKKSNCYTFSINLTKNTTVPIATVAIMYGSPFMIKSLKNMR